MEDCAQNHRAQAWASRSERSLTGLNIVSSVKNKLYDVLYGQLVADDVALNVGRLLSHPVTIRCFVRLVLHLVLFSGRGDIW